MIEPGAKKPLLPSLNALWAFEAAARHESFTRAASELGVTQTAVSHQVKALEDELGVQLFRRSPRRLALTNEGLAWAAELRVIFERLRDANTRLRARREEERPVVAVSIIPSFAARWLVPRLGQFMAEHPKVDVRLSASERLVDFGVEPFDLGVRYGLGRYPGLVSAKLADDYWVVVCTPKLRERLRLRIPGDLSRATLLGDDAEQAWADWFAAASSRVPAGVAQSQFTDSSMLVEAALRGQGVALARWSLASDELRSERLVLPFPNVPRVPTGLAYYLVGPRECLRRAPVAAFRDWLRREVDVLSSPPSSPASSDSPAPRARHHRAR